MRRFWAQVRKKLVAIPDRETLVSTRGFDVVDRAKIDRLESIGRTFVEGYHAAVGSSELGELHDALERVRPALRGFAYEGASMGLVVSDVLTPFARRWLEFSQTIGAPHVYMVHVGYGWALARLPISLPRAIQRLEDPLRWLAVDGYGFHQGYFDWRRYVAAGAVPAGLQGYALRAFDQGLGRSLWFVSGAQPSRIASAIERLGDRRAPDLWAGVGLAATYAAGASRAELSDLRALAGALSPHLAQGSAFAAEARRRAGNPTEDSELACRILCDVPFEEAARVARDAFPSARSSNGEEAYELWRTRIRAHFGELAVGAMA